jgi:DNA-binding transcriptional ArsR family regulator
MNNYSCERRIQNLVSQNNLEQCEYICVHEDIVKEVQKNMPSEEALIDLADFFKVFGDTTRIRILYVLFQSEMCVCDISNLLNMTQSAISHQLRTLKQLQLVKYRREGKTVFYSLSDDHIKIIINQGMEHINE